MFAMHSLSLYRSISRFGMTVMSISGLLLLLLTSCTEPLEYRGEKYDPYENYDALAKIVSERYCFFEQKGINWDSVCSLYRGALAPDMSDIDLFSLMGDLLDNLKDGHVNLTTPFATSYYKKWWSDYPQDYNERTLQQYYLKFGGMQVNGMTYCVFLPDTIGYVRIPSFSTALSAQALDYIMAFMQPTKGLIIDVRQNGGGYLTNVPELAGRFITEPITGGYISHKTGPGHNDFSKPYKIEYKPAGKDHIQYLGRPIAVLTNRSCFSAANDFVSVMKSIRNVEIIGSTTGGGGGMPFSAGLPNGWNIRFSACPINNAQHELTEFGIDPSPGCEVHCTAEELAAGKDAILDFAYRRLVDSPAVKTQ